MGGAIPATMSAWVFPEHGDPGEVLNLRQVPVPEPGPGQLLIAVDATAINFADSLVVRGTYQSSPPLPAVPGMEFAGRVCAVGSDVKVPIGTAVAGLGTDMAGGLAEYALIDEADAFTPPSGLSVLQAACFTVAYQTAWFALHVRGGLRRGETVLVNSAAGGVGLASVQLAAAAGARVIGIVGSERKAAAALMAGCAVVFVRGRDDTATRVKEAAGGGIDLIVDPVGGEAHTLSERVVRFEGRIVLLGFASGDLPVVRPDLLVVKNYSLVGVHWGLYRSTRPHVVAEQYARLVDVVVSAGIRPLVSEVFPFEQVPAAIAHVGNGRSIGRIAVLAPTHTATNL